MSRLLERIFAEGRRIWSERADLRNRYGDVASLGYWAWLMADGLRAYPALRALVPVPPPSLIGNVVSAADGIDFFQESGVNEARWLFSLLAAGGFDPAAGGALLDFGCGCARVLRFMARLGDSVALHGADPDRSAIAWCREHLDYARFECLPPWPPSPYPAASFRAVYAYSVFTHLEERLHRAWLAELHRIAAPGAVLVLTTAGRRCVAEMLGPRAGHFPIPTAAQLRADLPRLERGEYVFYPFDFAVESLPQEMAPAYGMTFLFEDYVRRHWLDRFELVAFHAGPTGWQDYVVLRRR